MRAGTTRPLIFVDIDGVLIPFRARSAGTRRLVGGVGDAADGTGNPLLDRLDPADGGRLLALAGELVWASTWMAEANEVGAPRLGLPALPVVDWPDDDEEPQRGLHWKTGPLTRWAAGRPFVWLDDEITDADRHWVASHHSQPALLLRIDPYAGLTDADVVAVRRWLEQRDVAGSAALWHRGDRSPSLGTVSGSPAMIRIRRVPSRFPWRREFEVEFQPRSFSEPLWRQVTRTPVLVLEPLVGIGDAWPLVDEANRQWRLGNRGWAVEIEEG